MKLARVLTSYIVIFVYVFFSQFVIKAWATTDESVIWSDDFCVIKKLDTYDGKYSCREKHNIAVFDQVYAWEVPLKSYIHNIRPEWKVHHVDVVNIKTNYKYTHPPPPIENIWNINFIYTFIWIILLLV